MLRKENQTLNNFNGTLLWKDLPILDFCIERGKVLKWEMHPENEDYYPIEFTYNATVYGLQDFIDCRIVPITRQNLQRVLKDLGLKEYSWAVLTRGNGDWLTGQYLCGRMCIPWTFRMDTPI